MKYLLFMLAILMSGDATAAVNITADPTNINEQKLILTCDYPIEREDGAPLALSEIAKVNFFVTSNGVRTAAGSNNAACTQTYDLTAVPDGSYVYTVQTEDTGGRVSADSTTVTMVVKRIANPNSPTNLQGTLGSLP